MHVSWGTRLEESCSLLGYIADGERRCWKKEIVKGGMWHSQGELNQNDPWTHQFLSSQSKPIFLGCVVSYFGQQFFHKKCQSLLKSGKISWLSSHSTSDLLQNQEEKNLCSWTVSSQHALAWHMSVLVSGAGNDQQRDRATIFCFKYSKTHL